MKRKMVLLISAAVMAMCFTQIVMAGEDVIITEEASQVEEVFIEESGFISAIETVDEATTVANIIADGACGDNLTWTLDDEGTLTISGTGEMYDFQISSFHTSSNYDSESIANTPWKDYAPQIRKVIIEDGVTSVSTYAFINYVDLIEVSIGNSVTEIGPRSFFNCNNLTNITIGENVVSIGYDAFLYSGLTEVVIPDSVTEIGNSAFYGCRDLIEVTIGTGLSEITTNVFCISGLTRITIANTVKTIDLYAFSGCEKLSDIYYDGSEEEWNAIHITAYDAYEAEYAEIGEFFYAATVHFISPTDDDVSTEGLILDDDGIYRYYENGEFVSGYNGLVSYDGSLFFITDGLINTSVNGLCQYEDTWYYAANGQVQTQYTDLALYDGSWFFITEGILDTSKIGLVPYDGEMFLVADGQLLSNYNGLWQNATSIGGDDKWYFIAAGMVQNVSQVVMYDGEFFVVENGILDSDYNGTIEYDGTTFTVVNGQLYG